MKPRDYLRVYLAVRRAGLGWWRALRCCDACRRGSWSARDAGELRAQMTLLAAALSDRENP